MAHSLFQIFWESRNWKMSWILDILFEFFFFELIIAAELVTMNTAEKLFVGFTNREPFVSIDQTGTLKGLDVLIMNNFARKFNLSLEYVEQNISLNEISNNKEAFEEYIQQTDMKKINLFIGALDENVVTQKHLIASRAYYHDALTWCVQIKQRIPKWKTIFYVCRDPLVFAIFTLMCTSVVFMGYFLQQYENFTPKWDWFRLTFAGISPCLGYGSEYFANIIPNRIFFLFSLLGAMLSYIVTVSFFLLFVTIPIYERQIQTRQQIIQKRFELVGDSFAFHHMRIQNQESFERFRICEDLNLCLSQLDQKKYLAVAISREYVRNSHLKLQTFCFEKPIYNYALKFLIRKDFPYLNELNKFIRMASAGGLIEKWRAEKRIRYRKQYNEFVYDYVNNETNRGSWTIYSILIVTVFLTLYCERLIHKKRRQPNPRRFWLVAERIIDPYRHFWLETKTLNGNYAF